MEAGSWKLIVRGNTYDNNAVRVVKYGDRSMTPKSVAFLARRHAAIFSTILDCNLHVNGI
jgi:hypothetical protein